MGSIYESVKKEGGMLSRQTVVTLYSQEFHKLQRSLTRKLGTVEDSEDALQDAYIRLLTSDVDDVVLEHPKAFLRTVANHIAVDRLRKRWRDRRLATIWATHEFTSDGASIDIVSTERGPDKQTEDLESLSAALSIIRGMPLKARRAFLLHKVQEFSQIQVAEILDVSVSMVEKYIGQAKRLLNIKQ
jgi:RNA polymerase sigma factor (sigma-70 family)